VSRPVPQLAGEPASKERLRLWLRLLKTVRQVENGLRARLRAEFATTLPRFDVLAMLDRAREGLTMSALSGRLMVSNGNVTGIVDRLVEDGLVIRVSVAGDRRATRVRLTPRGVEAFAAMAARHEAWVDELLAPLDAEEARLVAGLVGRIRREDA
jgi:DNA-binding MarR family transcriptional regulator